MKMPAPGLALVVLASLAGCAPPGPPAVDAGVDDDDDDLGGVDDDDAGAGGDAGVFVPDGKVRWSEELPNPYEFPGPDDEDGVLDPIAVDFFLQYTVQLPEKNEPPADLIITICMQPASWDEPTCNATPQVAVDGPGGYRWGFDPSQYDSGRNVYEHTLTLQHDGVVIDETTLQFVVTAP